MSRAGIVKLIVLVVALVVAELWCDVWFAVAGMYPLCMQVVTRPAEYWPLVVVVGIYLALVVIDEVFPQGPSAR